jgi:hypothetical protein
VRESALGTWFRDSLRKPFKRIAFLAFLISGILWSVCAPAKAPVSPRPLSKAHSSLNGTSRTVEANFPATLLMNYDVVFDDSGCTRRRSTPSRTYQNPTCERACGRPAKAPKKR